MCRVREVSGNSSAWGLAVYVCGGVPDAGGNCLCDGSPCALDRFSKQYSLSALYHALTFHP